MCDCLVFFCGRHHDTGEIHAKCKKALTFGVLEPIDGPEIQKRLKRWFVAGGTEEAAWPEDTKRTQHKEMGLHNRLKFLASDAPGWSGIDDEDLDEMVKCLATTD